MPTRGSRDTMMTRSRTRTRLPKMHSLRDLFLEEIKDLYDAEQQITKSLPKMVSVASSPDLKDAFEHHLQQTQEHLERLERILESQGASVKRQRCEGMEGLLKEGAEMLEATAAPEVKDAGLIGSAQRVEHYEIAGYGTARTFAEHLGERDAARLLQETLDEEGAADKTLTQIAQHINVKAAEREDAERHGEESDAESIEAQDEHGAG